MPALAEAQRALDACRQQTRGLLVAYSGGKDSRVVLDLAVRAFEQVEAFHMTLVPGLECVETWLAEARRRYGITIRQYPHPILGTLIRKAVYCDPSMRRDSVPKITLSDIYGLAMADSGIGWIAAGNKRTDSAWRRGFMTLFSPERVIYPLISWHRYDVIGYLRLRGIPVPSAAGSESSGIDLSRQSLCWLHETYPEDFRKVCEVFPYAEAVVWQRKFYAHAA